MKNARITIILLLTLFTQAYAAVPIDGWYSALFGGYAYLPNNLSTFNSELYFSNSSYNSGYNVGGRFGYKSNPMRYEGELTYINADAAQFKVNNIRQTNITGFNSTTALMANVYYDFPELISTIEPFIGLGMGFAWVDTRLINQTAFNYIKFSGSDIVFAYQATAGLTYNFSEKFSLDVAYRYLGTSNVEYLGDNFQANLITAGVTYRFDDSRYK